MYVVVTGTVFDGLILHGPFENYEVALEWSQDMLKEWEIVQLEPVKKE